MKHLILIAAVCVSSAAASAQTTRVYAKHLQATEKLQLKTRTITDFSISLFSADSSSDTKIPTAKAVADFVRARAGGGAGGAVSSVFGRTGAVVANAGDYSAFYANLSHTHPLGDLLQSGAALGQVPVWTITGWQPGTVSGGGSGDSSWNSTETGVQPNMLGHLVNSTLTALPSGWVDATPSASVTFSGKMIVSGGTTGTSSLLGNEGASTVYSNRIEMGFYPYSKMKYSFVVVPKDKTSTSEGFALHFTSNALFYSAAMQIKFNLTNGADSGKITMAYDFGSTIASSSNLSHAVDDSLIVEIVKDFWLIKATVLNKRTGKYVDCKFYSYGSAFGTGGKAYLGLLGGTQHFLSAKVISYDLKDGAAITFIGDSQTAGSGATSEEKIFPLQVMRGSKLKTANLANGSLTISAAVNSHIPAAILLNNPVIINLGYNDRRDLVNDTATFKTRLTNLVNPLVSANIPIYGICTIVQAVGASVNFNTAIRNFCAANGYRVIDIDSALAKPSNFGLVKENYLSADAIHWSDSGQVVGANKVLSTIGNLIQPFFKDTTSPVKHYNVPIGERNMNQLVIDNEGNVKQLPQTTFDVIYNSRSYNGAGTVAQPGSFHISGEAKTDSALLFKNKSGAQIGFNESTGTNVEITNYGVGGTGSPQRFALPPTSSNNILIGGQNKSFIPAITTASSNIWLGYYSNYGATTAQRNFAAQLSGTNNTSSGNSNITIVEGNFGGTASNQILFGWGSGGYGNASNRIHIGYASYGAASSSETVFAPAENGAITTYFTQKTMYSGSSIMKIGANGNGGNTNGFDWNFESGLGNGTGNSGAFNFKTTSPSAHGSYVTRFSIQNHNVLLGSARFQTTQGSDIASANDLTLPNNGNDFRITGTTQINAITTANWQNGSEITLLFTGNVLVKNNTAGGAGTAVIRLEGGVDFSATADDLLKLKLISGVWYQSGKSIN